MILKLYIYDIYKYILNKILYAYFSDHLYLFLKVLIIYDCLKIHNITYTKKSKM